MKQFTLNKIVFAILVIQACRMEEQVRDYSVLKVVGAIGGLSALNKLKFKLFVFKHQNKGKSDTYYKMQKTVQTIQTESQVDFRTSQEICPVENLTILNEIRTFDLLYNQTVELELTKDLKGQYQIPYKILVKMTQKNLKGEYNIIQKTQQQEDQIIKSFFEHGDQTDQKFTQLYADNLDIKNYQTQSSLQFENSPINFHKNILFVMDFIQQNDGNANLSYFQLESNTDKKNKIFTLKVFQRQEQQLRKKMKQGILNFFSTTNSKKIEDLAKQRSVYYQYQQDQLRLEYFQGDIQFETKQKKTKDENGNQVIEEVNTGKLLIPKQNQAKFKLIDTQNNTQSEFAMNDKATEIFGKNKQLHVYCQLAIDKINLATEYFTMYDNVQDTQFYVSDNRYEFVEECWKKIESRINCKVQNGGGLSIVNIKQSQQFEKSVSKDREEIEEIDEDEVELDQEDLQLQNQFSPSLNEDQFSPSLNQNSFINQESSYDQPSSFNQINLDGLQLKRILGKQKVEQINQTLVTFEILCEKSGFQNNKLILI